MGLVVDLAGSEIDVGDNSAAPKMYAVANEIVCQFASFETRFAFMFKKGAGVPPPTRTQSWRIGVIQNVLAETCHFKWDDGQEHHVNWVKPALDSGAVYGFPFYQDGPDSSGDGDPSQQNPYRDVYYGPDGFGEILDPWASPDNNIATKSSWWVTSADQPQFGCNLRTSSGGLLVSADQVITFGIWLVAIDYEQRQRPQVLAHAPPFSMVYSVKLGSGGSMGLLEFPDAPYFSYAVPGFVQKANPALQSVNSPGLRIATGQGSRAPTMKGETANTRERRWAVGTILAV